MMLSWKAWDEPLPPRPFRGETLDETTTHTPRCSWCGDAPVPGHTLCHSCQRDLDAEMRVLHGDTP